MMGREFPPELVAPVVALLAHERYPTSGAYFETAGDRVAERYLCETRGYTNRELTIEDLLECWDEVVDRTDARELPNPIEDETLLNFTPPPHTPA
jgi:hypothetical protein